MRSGLRIASNDEARNAIPTTLPISNTFRFCSPLLTQINRDTGAPCI